MKEFKIPERFAALGDVLRYDTELKERGKAGHFSALERIQINQERGQLLSGNENYHHAQALREKIEFVIEIINNLNK